MVEKNLCKKEVGCPFLMSLFDSIDLYCVLINKSNEILYCSEKFKKTFNYVDIIGKKIPEIISKNDYEEIRKLILESIFTNKNSTGIIQFQNDQYYKIISYPVLEGNGEGFDFLFLVAFNITEEEIFRKENEELKKKLEESNSIKSIFLSNISHELRTPMNSIIGFSEILLQNKNRNHLDRFIKSIDSNAKYLDELLNNMLDYSKIEYNEFDILYENFSISDLFEELYDIFQDVNYKKNLNFVKLEFNIDDDKKIISDYLRLKQILFNIISNSIKFTDSGYIRVSFTESDNFITFIIEDSGIGIEPDKIQHVFERFWQGDSTSRKKYRGTGLGLSISKSIVEMLNGDIWLESIVNKGTTFYVKIPLEEIKQDVINNITEKLNFSGKTILLIDELPVNYSLIGIYLNTINIKILSASNIKEAITIYKKQKDKIDLIILDLDLSEGLEISKKIKNLNQDIKIISKSINEIKDKSIDFNLKKPVNKDKLIEILKTLWQK
jgi:signal transduction histidine kinase